MAKKRIIPGLNGKVVPKLEQAEIASLRFSREYIASRERELDLLRMGQAQLLGNILRKYGMSPDAVIDLNTGQITETGHGRG